MVCSLDTSAHPSGNTLQRHPTEFQTIVLQIDHDNFQLQGTYMFIIR